MGRPKQETNIEEIFNEDTQIELDIKFKKQHSYIYCYNQMEKECFETLKLIMEHTPINKNNDYLENKRYAIWLVDGLFNAWGKQAKKQVHNKRDEQRLCDLNKKWLKLKQEALKQCN